MTVGADKTARLFDTRNLTESHIIYDYSEPLIRIAWNNSQHSNQLATISLTGHDIILLDIRYPLYSLAKLSYH